MRDAVRSSSHRPFIALMTATVLSLASCDTVEDVKGLIVGQTLPPPVEKVAPSSSAATKQSAASTAPPAIADTSQSAPSPVPPAGSSVATAPPASGPAPAGAPESTQPTPIPSTSVAQATAPLPAQTTATAPAATAPAGAAPAHPSTSAPTATAPAPAQSSGAASTDPDQEEALSFYEDVMLTYAFDACGLPLLGAVTRQDIAHRLDVCPAPAARKEALRVVFQRAIADAERDPAKTRAGALALCADKRAFLRNVLRHANELTVDDNAPPNCSLITPPTAPPRP